MEEMDLAIKAATSPAVQIWMNWMLIVFAASLIFVWKYTAARVVVAAFLLTMPIALLIFNLSNSAHLIGIAHLIVWSPLAYYLVRYEVKKQAFKFGSVYGVWVVLLLGTIFVSLIFDVRDAVLVFQGVK